MSYKKKPITKEEQNNTQEETNQRELNVFDVQPNEDEIEFSFKDIQSCIDINKIFMIKNSSIKEFICHRTNTIAVEILQEAFQNNFFYDESRKKWFFYKKDRYYRLADIYQTVYIFLFYLINHIKKINDIEYRILKDEIEKTIKAIERTKFKADTIKELCVREGIFNESIPFDGYQIRETLTLKDCVLDFSGSKLKIRQGKHKEYRKKYLPITKKDIEEAGEPVYFLQFIKQLFPDPETRNTVIYVLAATISGNSTFRKLIILWGLPRTGKSTFIEVKSRVILPGFTVSVNPEILLQGKTNYGNANSPTPEIAKLEGMYSADVIETEQGRRLNSAMCKNLTGGDKLTGRWLWENSRDFLPTHQLYLTTNYLPHFQGADTALVDRLLTIPFNNEFKAGMKNTRSRDEIIKNLEVEQPAIIKFLTKNYIILKNKLQLAIPESEECKSLKRRYVQDENELGTFINEMCIINPTDSECKIKKDMLAKTYRDFCGISENKFSDVSFSRILTAHYLEIKTERIYDKATKRKIPYFVGIRLKSETEQITEEDLQTVDKLF